MDDIIVSLGLLEDSFLTIDLGITINDHPFRYVVVLLTSCLFGAVDALD